MFLAKDFVETEENLLFAVVSNGLEQGKVLVFLRYVQNELGRRKYATDEANQLLQQHYPDYLHYSPVLDCTLHAVPVERISKHYSAQQTLQAMLGTPAPDAVTADLMALCQLLQQQGVDLRQWGITGSLLIGAQQQGSDIDLVCYDAANFHHCRAVLAELITQGKLSALSELDWQQSYQRRDCDLSFADYVWHEQRKLNKALINGRKFDLSLLNPANVVSNQYQKCGMITVQCQVIDDSAAFDYPAQWLIDHEQIYSVVSFTATYTGQAIRGEFIEIAGQVEQNAQGVKRLVVGSSREARGEYIKVLSIP
jgi:predicted nucleotidyltransferase